jgi:hypothetical protein
MSPCCTSLRVRLENDKEIISWVEYRLDDELVHRSVHVVLKQSVAADGVAAAIG